jgi:hypothetical protein
MDEGFGRIEVRFERVDCRRLGSIEGREGVAEVRDGCVAMVVPQVGWLLGCFRCGLFEVMSRRWFGDCPGNRLTAGKVWNKFSQYRRRTRGETQKMVPNI